MTAHASGHCGRDAKGLVDAAEVVMHVVQADSGHVVLDLLAESVGQAGETAHSHAHSEVLALNVRGGNVRLVGIT